MNTELTIVGLGGSLATPSKSLEALRIALDGAAAAGATTHLLDIRELALPFYMPAMTDVPRAAQELCDLVYAADGMIWSSPLYHGTISGAFKNALDWLDLLGKREPPFLTDKVVGLISTAGGTQGLQAVNTMEFVVRALRGWAVPLVIPISNAGKSFDRAGQVRDPQIEQQLHALGGEVARAATRFGASPLTTPDVEEAEDATNPSDRPSDADA